MESKNKVLCLSVSAVAFRLSQGDICDGYLLYPVHTRSDVLGDEPNDEVSATASFYRVSLTDLQAVFQKAVQEKRVRWPRQRGKASYRVLESFLRRVGFGNITIPKGDRYCFPLAAQRVKATIPDITVYQ